MPSRLPLQPTANQALSALLDGQSYRLEFKATRGVMAVSISINDVVVVSGDRFFADAPLIPYAHLEGDGGNFLITTEGDSIPDFAQFDVTQFLIYLTAAEVASARA